MRFLSLLVAVALASCVQPVPMVAETAEPPLPVEAYAEAARAGAKIFRIEPLESRVIVRVGRAGSMKSLGHDHAIASEDVQGYAEFDADLSTAWAHIVFPVRNLVVDRPDYRAHFELDTQPADDDIAGTYTNMLKVLEPELYPWVQVRARVASGSIEKPELAVSIDLHGTSFDYLVPVELVAREDRLIVDGNARIKHSDFGLEPFSAVGGLLRVADELEIDIHLVAHRLH